MATTTRWGAGFLFSAALVIAGPCLAQSAPASKAEPPPHPGPSVKMQITPPPRPEPPAASKAKPAAAAKPVARPIKPLEAKKSSPAPRRAAKRSRRIYAQTPPPRHRETRQDRWRYSYREERAVREPAHSFRSATRDARCDEVCAYREWAERYRAWYERYGRAYGAYGAGPEAPHYESRVPAGPPRQAADWRARQWRESERARLDPWHGYNSRDGLENGY